MNVLKYPKVVHEMIYEDNKQPLKLQKLSLGNVNMGAAAIKTKQSTELLIKHVELLVATPRQIGEKPAEVCVFAFLPYFEIFIFIFRSFIQHWLQVSSQWTQRSIFSSLYI